ncbi:ABC transporter permease subunit [Capsulimonas corticalis]|uniref:ABC transporter permease subunit n=1 Tax=Capsulimonas corticalis TaxID=2219043 RepID=UPI0014025B21|nr:ABC transporter permease subunit [Capsulimonas corticalis]
MTENPVLLREVRSRLRWRRLPMATLLRAGAIVTVLAIVCYARLITLIHRGRADDATSIWWVIAYVLLFLVALLAPALAATAISQEREQQTWEGLIVTRLTPMQILLGKWTARQMLLGIALLILAPLMIAVAVKGGVSLITAVLTLLTLTLSSGFYSGIGMLCSFIARRTPAATASSLVIVVFLCLGTIVVNSIMVSLLQPMNYSNTPSQISPMLWLNPFITMDSVQQIYNTPDNRDPQWLDAYITQITMYLSLTAVLTTMIFAFMIGRYRKPSREG